MILLFCLIGIPAYDIIPYRHAKKVTQQTIPENQVYDNEDKRSKKKQGKIKSIPAKNTASTSKTQTVTSRCRNCSWKVIKSDTISPTWGDLIEESSCTMCSKLSILKTAAENYAKGKHSSPGDDVGKEMETSGLVGSVIQNKRKHCSDHDENDANLNKRAKIDASDKEGPPGNHIVEGRENSPISCAVKQKKRKHCSSESSENLTKKAKTDDIGTAGQTNSKLNQKTKRKKKKRGVDTEPKSDVQKIR